MMSTDTDTLKELDFDLPCSSREHRYPTAANYYVHCVCPGCGAHSHGYMCHSCWLSQRLMNNICGLCGTWSRFEATVTNRDQIKDLQ